MSLKGNWAIAVGTALAVLGVLDFSAPANASTALTLHELRQLHGDNVSSALARKARAAIDEVVVRNTGSAAASLGIHVPATLRVTEYNIERGEAYESLETLFTDCARFNRSIMRPGTATSLTCRIADSDLLLLVETDDGVCRTGYRNVAEDLALAMGYHFAYATEFLEIDPKLTGASSTPVAGCESVSPGHARNRHGDAILSRYPIRRARRLALERCYDWFSSEKYALVMGALSKNQVRRGERMALIADIELPGGKLVTVVNAHLENKTDGACRYRQMNQILKAVKHVPNPVIVGGDWNTTGFDGSTWNPLRLATREYVTAALQRDGFDLSANDGKTTMSGTVAGAVLSRVDFLAAKGFCGRARNARTHTELLNSWVELSDHLPISAEFPLDCP